MVPLFKVEEGIGEVDNVFMAIDVGHGGKSKVEEKVQVEEYQRKTMETTKAKPQNYIYQVLAFNQVPYLYQIFPNPYLFIKPSTLTVLRDFLL